MGSRYVRPWLNRQLAELHALLKLPSDFVLHSFRHTYGARLGETGADAFTIMKLMGHSTVTVSQRYVHPTPEAMENAVSRMEAWNAARLHKVGTVAVATLAEKFISYLESDKPGWRNRQTQRT